MADLLALRAHYAKAPKPGPRSPSLLAGLVRCTCGYPMRGSGRKYQCVAAPEHDACGANAATMVGVDREVTRLVDAALEASEFTQAQAGYVAPVTDEPDFEALMVANDRDLIALADRRREHDLTDVEWADERRHIIEARHALELARANAAASTTRRRPPARELAERGRAPTSRAAGRRCATWSRRCASSRPVAAPTSSTPTGWTCAGRSSARTTARH